MNLTDWPTKQEAATALGVSTKTVEKFAADGKLQSSKRAQQGRPAVTVYHPEDVKRLQKERQPEAFVVPVREASEKTSQTSQSLTAPGLGEFNQNGGAFLAALTEKLLEASQKSSAPRLFLSLKEAAHFTGLTQGYLRKLVESGELPAVQDGRRRRIRRRDLEGL